MTTGPSGHESLGTTTNGRGVSLRTVLNVRSPSLSPAMKRKRDRRVKHDEVACLGLLLNPLVGRADYLHFRMCDAGFVASCGKLFQKLACLFDARPLAEPRSPCNKVDRRRIFRPRARPVRAREFRARRQSPVRQGRHSSSWPIECQAAGPRCRLPARSMPIKILHNICRTPVCVDQRRIWFTDYGRSSRAALLPSDRACPIRRK